MKRKWWLYLCIILLVCVGIFAFWKYQKTDKAVKEEQGILQSVEEAYDLIRKESVHETSENQLVEGAINGMAGALRSV